jgi:hypothetical protein
LIRLSVRLFSTQQASWELFAFFNPLLIIYVECQLGESPSMTLASLMLFVRKYAKFVAGFCRSIGGDLVSEWASKQKSIKHSVADFRVLVNIIDRIPGVLRETRGSSVEFVQLR